MDIAKLHLHWGASNYKGKTSRSYSLALPYRKDGKNRKEIILKLGKLTDAQASRWRDLLKAIKNPNAFIATLDDLVVVERFAYLNVAAANKIWDDWKLDDAFSNNDKKKLSCAIIARILTLNRCIDPSTKSQTPEWFQNTVLPWILDIDLKAFNASRIFRELDVIYKCKEAICKHLYERLREQDPDSMTSVFYDLSSTMFHGSRCVLMKWGHCKEGYHNHVVLALVVNRKGFPFYWEVLQGGTADTKTISWLLGRLKERFKLTKTTLIFDRGMVSNDNLVLLEIARIKYITAMDKNQLEGITGIDFTKYSDLKPDRIEEQTEYLSEFTKTSDNTYCREMKIDGERRYILCFNPQLFKDQRKARSKMVEDFRLFVNNVNDELCKAKQSRHRKSTYNKFKQRIDKCKLTNYIDVHLETMYVKRKNHDGSERNIRTYKGAVVVDETRMIFSGRLDGFWLLVTNHKDKQGDVFNVSAKDAITPYQMKTVIESAFRDIKSFVEIAPVHVWTEAHVKAHYDVCVLSHLINQTITFRLHKNSGQLTKEIVSHERFYAKLSDCMIDHIKVKNVSMSTYSMTHLNDYTKELLQRVGMEKLLSDDVVKKARNSM